MNIKIIGAESLGVRGLSCVIEVGDRKIFIDPGISLGYRRNGRMPHPVQVGVGCIIRDHILDELRDATDIVLSHFHGDHIPLFDANPYQLAVGQVKGLSKNCRMWADAPDASDIKMVRRAEGLVLGLNKDIQGVQGYGDDALSFHGPLPHGENHSHCNQITMTRITDGHEVFLHASDVQLLSEDAVDQMLECEPDIVLASGPPLYLADYMKSRSRQVWHNALKLARNVHTLILDHHLLRCESGIKWLEELASVSGHQAICAADYMGIRRHLLEAWRSKLYEDLPVPDGWHQRYAENKTDTSDYIAAARERYDWFSY